MFGILVSNGEIIIKATGKNSGYEKRIIVTQKFCQDFATVGAREVLAILISCLDNWTKELCFDELTKLAESRQLPSPKNRR
jgi:hypothetical protein